MKLLTVKFDGFHKSTPLTIKFVNTTTLDCDSATGSIYLHSICQKRSHETAGFFLIDLYLLEITSVISNTTFLLYIVFVISI